MPASLEVELKLRADDERPLRLLASVESIGPCHFGAAREVEELDRYLDTADGRLSDARWACRLRTREGSTRLSLKGPAQHSTGDSVHRRPELEAPASEMLDPGGWPASEARDRLLELSHGAPMVERLALQQARTEREVAVDGKRAGLLSLDRVSVLHGGALLGTFAVVELELAAQGEERLVPELLTALRSVPGLLPDPRTKLERALDLVPAGT